MKATGISATLAAGQQWLGRMTTRDRRALLAGGTALAVILLWALVYAPLQDRRDELQRQVEALQRTLTVVEDAGRRTASLRTHRPAGAAPVGANGEQSLVTLVDTSGRNAGLAAAMRRIEPLADEATRVDLQQAPFEQLIVWLQTLATRHGVVAREISLDRRDTGVVDARVQLQRSPSG